MDLTLTRPLRFFLQKFYLVQVFRLRLNIDLDLFRIQNISKGKKV